LKAALQVGERLQSADTRGLFLTAAGAAMAAAGERSLARSTLAAALTGSHSGVAEPVGGTLKLIAIAQARTGRFADAFRTLATVEDKDGSFEQIAACQVQAGDIEGALETVCQIEDKIWRHLAVKSLAEQHARAGAFSAALNATERMDSGLGQKAETLAMIAGLQASAGDLHGALRAARIALDVALGIRSEPYRAMGVVSAVSALAKAGDLLAAFENAARIEKYYYRAKAMASIAGAMAESQDFEGALNVANQILLEDVQAGALASIQAVRARTQGYESARSVLAQVAERLERFQSDRTDKSNALTSIALAQAEAGDFSGATRTAQMHGAPEKDRVLESIAMIQAQAGQPAAALETVRLIGFPLESLEALKKVARVQARAGDSEAVRGTLDVAMEAADNLSDQTERARELSGIARVFAEAGFAARALNIAERLLSERDAWLPSIAESFAEAGDLNHFKRLLSLCAYYRNAAYRMCGLLARFYPEQATAVALVVSPSENGAWKMKW
jgi:tetratricopeptide (TPR) repeat protein